MPDDWIRVYSSNKVHIIEILKQVLSDGGIKAMTIDKRDSAYLFGDIELYVKNDDVMKAKVLIDKFENWESFFKEHWVALHLSQS